MSLEALLNDKNLNAVWKDKSPCSKLMDCFFVMRKEINDRGAHTSKSMIERKLIYFDENVS